jgi:hypothetical protein
MADLVRLDPADVAGQGQVQLYSAAGALADPVTCRLGSMLSTLGDTFLPEDHPEVDVPGVVLEQYLGGGGQGWVYAGRVKTTGCLVAVKVLRSDYVAAQGQAAREALLCSRIRHRNILRVFQAQEAGEYWVMLMELVQGPDLNAVNLTPDRGRPLFGQLAAALHSLTAARIVHRDVKPANILLREQDFSPVLVDFGLAVDLTAPDGIAPSISGTPFFMPPEAFRYFPPEPSWDAYSLGLTAIVALLGPAVEYATLAAVRSAKLDGTFHVSMRKHLEQIDDAGVREWIAALLDDDSDKRLAALAAARDWN